MDTEYGQVGPIVLPLGLVDRWEAAYRRYGDAWDYLARCPSGDREAAEAFATASWQVAMVWRDMAATVLPWWAVTALRTTADAFEQQARTWNTRTTPPQQHQPSRIPPTTTGRTPRRPGPPDAREQEGNPHA